MIKQKKYIFDWSKEKRKIYTEKKEEYEKKRNLSVENNTVENLIRYQVLAQKSDPAFGTTA